MLTAGFDLRGPSSDLDCDALKEHLYRSAIYTGEERFSASLADGANRKFEALSTSREIWTIRFYLSFVSLKSLLDMMHSIVLFYPRRATSEKSQSGSIVGLFDVYWFVCCCRFLKCVGEYATRDTSGEHSLRKFKKFGSAKRLKMLYFLWWLISTRYWFFVICSFIGRLSCRNFAPRL